MAFDAFRTVRSWGSKRFDIRRQIRPWSISIRTHAECREAIQTHASQFLFQRAVEDRIEEQLDFADHGRLPGYCWVCNALTAFAFDRLYSDGKNINWRERLVCPRCRLNNRLRLAIQTLERMTSDKRSHIYTTEQLTPLARRLKRRFPNIASSEYLGPRFAPGQRNLRGTRHEDVTSLSFPANSFDFVLSFDVLEHVPDYRAALHQFHRVLKPGGRLILSAPFVLSADHNIVRARLDERDNPKFLLPPEYHGDPVNPKAGVLCFYHFGWELLEDLRTAGFSDVSLSMTWSQEFGHIGEDQVFILATR